jgi:hypothetical protein
MKSEQRRLKRFVRAIAFSLGAVFLGALHTGTASAQCVGPIDSTFSTACGANALARLAIFGSDTAFGFDALATDDDGNENTAIGANALAANSSGNDNTATGYNALVQNTGSDNTATGSKALPNNTTGLSNTASGFEALESNTTGGSNTATGSTALQSNTEGGLNTATGVGALSSNTTGNLNTATGGGALFFNTTGMQNTASGVDALLSNITGSNNTASGRNALQLNTTGSFNVVLGEAAGNNIVAGDNDIDIGAGSGGTSDESKTIRIGVQGTQTATFIAGISGNTQTGASGDVVEISSDGQLGIRKSAARYKRDIHDMGSASSGLMKLRPVTFRYKNDPSGTLQYGLIAEEVARVYPQLVTRGSDGKLESVHYLDFTALLLNELQKQERDTRAKDQQLAQQQREIDALKQQNASINALSERLAALERLVPVANGDRLRSLASK